MRDDTYLGPRGANGSRPLLGRRAPTPPAPATAGARAASARGPAQHHAIGGGQPPPRAPPRQAAASSVDEDGYQTVTRKVKPRVGSSPPVLGQAAAGQCGGTSGQGTHASWAEVARRSVEATGAGGDDGDNGDLDMDRDDDVDHIGGLDDDDALTDFDEEAEEVDDDGGCEDVGGEEDPGGDVEALRKEWERARLAHRKLERSSDMPPSLIEEARRLRDAAEAKWRAAKQPHPLHKRLRWAQRDLDAAVLKQRVHQEEMDQALEEMATRRKSLEDRAQADKERTDRKRRALQDLHDMGGPRAPAVSDSESAARVAVDGIQLELGPTLCAIAEKVEDGSPAWMELQAAMSTLHQVQAVLQRAYNADCAKRVVADARPTDDDTSGSPTCYDISGGGSDAGMACGQLGDGGHGGQAAGAAAATGHTSSARAEATRGAPIASAQRWAGPARTAADRWGGHAWRRNRGDGDAATVPPTALGGGAVPAAGSAAAAKEAARRQLAAHQQQLEQAQAKEKEVAEAARAHQAEAERMQQMQLAQQQQAAADAAAAAETVKRAQDAVAKAEAEEAQRLARERQEAAARMSPEERRRAEELHAQQSAIAAAGFGTDQAAQGVGLVHQAAKAAGDGGCDDIGDIMAMSPEQWHESLPVDSSGAGW